MIILYFTQINETVAVFLTGNDNYCIKLGNPNFYVKKIMMELNLKLSGNIGTFKIIISFMNFYKLLYNTFPRPQVCDFLLLFI